LLKWCVFVDFEKCGGASFDQLFAVNICKLQEMILSSPRLAGFADRVAFNVEGTSQCDVRWHFVVCNIQLLQLL